VIDRLEQAFDVPTQRRGSLSAGLMIQSKSLKTRAVEEGFLSYLIRRAEKRAS
jgi:hypothetical protein